MTLEIGGNLGLVLILWLLLHYLTRHFFLSVEDLVRINEALDHLKLRGWKSK